MRRALGVAESVNGRPHDDPFRGLHIDAAAIARALAQPPAEPLLGPTASDGVLPAAAPPDSRLAQLADVFDLSPFDVDLLIVALGPELDLRYRRMLYVLAG